MSAKDASNSTTPKPATPITVTANKSVSVPHDDADFERARRGLIARHAAPALRDARGRVVSDAGVYAFLEGDAPPTVNPSLWRQAQLNAEHGLFEVTEGMWQVRGYDISNITFIKSNAGWIVIDPLTHEVTAREALRLANEHLGQRPVVAVIYTHSHVDHFGGVLGVTSQEDVDAGRCQVIAPEGFLRETVGENVIAGPAMGRRAMYQFGAGLPSGERQHVDCGLGKMTPTGAPGLIAPTHEITRTGEELVVDGVPIVFQLTPETEAPAEMNFFFPKLKALCMAENCCHTMHNLVPIRGAQVRDALQWSKYINEVIALFGGDTDIMFASHHWPRWGRDDVHEFLVLQRDLYKWIHDQTMRQANHGHTAPEIAAMLELPEDFLANSHTHGYYGDLVHNVKAVYQRYLSWYDANPAHLNPHPPVEAARRYVDFMGGGDSVLTKARAAFDEGDYRWVAEVVNHLVFTDPSNTAARDLQADALEQLGYQSESATFRNAYLTGAHELRNGVPNLGDARARGKGMIRAMTIEQMFDTLGIRLISENVKGVRVVINWHFTDINEHWVLELSHHTLHATPNKVAVDADATVTIARTLILSIMNQETTFMDEVQAGTVSIDGDASSLLTVFGNLDLFVPGFAIVEP